MGTTVDHSPWHDHRGVVIAVAQSQLPIHYGVVTMARSSWRGHQAGTPCFPPLPGTGGPHSASWACDVGAGAPSAALTGGVPRGLCAG
eukprot:1159512-Pelagomonas_calceolata.AAC.8